MTPGDPIMSDPLVVIARRLFDCWSAAQPRGGPVIAPLVRWDELPSWQRRAWIRVAAEACAMAPSLMEISKL